MIKIILKIFKIYFVYSTHEKNDLVNFPCQNFSIESNCTLYFFITLLIFFSLFQVFFYQFCAFTSSTESLMWFLFFWFYYYRWISFLDVEGPEFLTSVPLYWIPMATLQCVYPLLLNIWALFFVANSCSIPQMYSSC